MAKNPNSAAFMRKKWREDVAWRKKMTALLAANRKRSHHEALERKLAKLQAEIAAEKQAILPGSTSKKAAPVDRT